MRRRNKYSGVYSFLSSTGLLENGSGKAIELAKKKYWSNYKKQWKKEKQKERKKVEIVFSLAEFKIITREAERNHTNPTSYIKQSALTNSQAITDPTFIGEFRELLIMHHNTLQALSEARLIPGQPGSQLLKQIAEIETKALEFFSAFKQQR